jgi:hypothetical protein
MGLAGILFGLALLEVLGGEGMAVGPFVTGTKFEDELAAVADVVAFQNVGMERELVVIDDQPGIAVDRHQRRIARTRHQHVELAARLAWAVGSCERPDHPRLFGNALGDWRQGPRLHPVRKHWGFLQRKLRIGSEGRAAAKAEKTPVDESATLHVRDAHCRHDRSRWKTI